MKRILITSLVLLSQAVHADITTTQAQGIMVVNPDSSNATVIQTNPDLSYQMMGNQAGVGRELILLKAKAEGETNSVVTAGGELQVNGTANSDQNVITTGP